MKSDRLLSILLLLQTRGRVPAAELAERLEVSPRTIYRDVEALSAAGVPVYSERGRHGGIALLPGFRTDVTGLTADEARALFVLTAQGAHRALGLDGALDSALRKVMAALPAPHRPAAETTSRRILVDPDRWLAGPRPAAEVDVLHAAVVSDRRLRIRYRHSGETRPRGYTVDPYGLVAKAGTWYLVADRRGRARLFRADRIASATVADAPVRRRPGVELADAWAGLRSQVERRPGGLRVRLRIRTARLDVFARIVGGWLTGPPAAAGEWATAELAYPELGWVRQLLQFGADLEVLDPPEVRRELARVAAEVTGVYARDAGAGPEPDPGPAPPADRLPADGGRSAGG
ncbi:helix-turn-helix transcriptional regulator [Streptomyces sp. NPDC018031]|uniref:helix-turn-helix transcriptional regulator n=1 Tax=Streptomyces sp. NPDC018031 TaxID=3365033 RepID=UPI0037BCE637